MNIPRARINSNHFRLPFPMSQVSANESTPSSARIAKEQIDSATRCRQLIKSTNALMKQVEINNANKKQVEFDDSYELVPRFDAFDEQALLHSTDNVVPKKQVFLRSVLKVRFAPDFVPKKQVTFRELPKYHRSQIGAVRPPDSTFQVSNLDTTVELVKNEPDVFLTEYEKVVLVPILANLIPESVTLWIVARRVIATDIDNESRMFMYVTNIGSIALFSCSGKNVAAIHCEAHLAPILNIIEQFRPRIHRKYYLKDFFSVFFRHVLLDTIKEFMFEGVTMSVIDDLDRLRVATKKDPGCVCDLKRVLRLGMQSVKQVVCDTELECRMI